MKLQQHGCVVNTLDLKVVVSKAGLLNSNPAQKKKSEARSPNLEALNRLPTQAGMLGVQLLNDHDVGPIDFPACGKPLA